MGFAKNLLQSFVLLSVKKLETADILYNYNIEIMWYDIPTSLRARQRISK